MNKRYLLLLLIFCCAFTAQSQSTTTPATEPNFHFGLKISPTIAYIKPTSSELEKNCAKLGFSYGIMTEFKIQENYAVGTGLQVTYRGGNIIVKDKTLGNVSAKLNLEYLELPVTLKMKTNTFNKMKYFGQVGVVTGWNIKAIKKYDNSNYNDNLDVANFNMAMTIGIGTEYIISGSTVLVTSLEYNNGFIDIFNGGNQAITNYFGLNVGVLF